MSIQNNSSAGLGDDSLKAIFGLADVKKFKVIPSDQKRHYVVYYGSISREDGIEEAVKLALMAEVKLIIIGKPDPRQQAYFEYIFLPSLDDWRQGNIEYLSSSEISHQKLNTLLGEALVVINPTNRNDVSGIECLQANACGTPVFSNPRGIMEHIITPGTNGYFGTLNGGMEKYYHHALEQIQLCVGIEPEWCRRQSEELSKKITMVGKVIEESNYTKQVPKTFVLAETA